MSHEQEQTTAAGTDGGLLDGAEAFDMGAYADQLKAEEPEHYAQDELGGEEPYMEAAPMGDAGAGTTMGEQAKIKTANMLLMMVDRLQQNVFATIAGNDTPSETFAMKKGERAEMAGYLAEGIPDNFKLPWWVPFCVMLGWVSIVNVQKLRTIKEEQRKAAELLRKQKAKEDADAAQAGMRAAASQAPPPGTTRASRGTRTAKAPTKKAAKAAAKVPA